MSSFKKFLLKSLIFVSFPVFINSQPDTTKWYPLDTGNLWEYHDPFYGDFFSVKVGNDTLLENGKLYKTIWTNYNASKNWSLDGFERIEKGKYFRKNNDEMCDEKEDLFYDFNVEDSSIWKQCSQFFALENQVSYNGLIRTYISYDNTTNLNLPIKEFTTVTVDTSNTPYDTLWNPIFGHGWITITKGVGNTKILAEFTDWVLHGAILDGELYGEIVVGVKNEKEVLNKFKLYQNYPNPFNPETSITYILKEEGHITLKVYNSLGQEIKTLVNEFKDKGSHKINFDGANLPSGVYVYSIQANDFTESKKMILFK